ncbi:yjeF-like protein, hydroxyethylthiazole kinase-related protein [Synechococcus sp. PCC 7502]|uniref:bifunctional ADP-dependent NAD(P)H-hydrate dehydratase/NAD(P)H-hydrate epimerase n=1 Tax=Synechococcus sp. PCC 7502 TaxID=1173263 RepID=UPI00029FDFAD|nr:bifunctional ADP-dependent NAD(P)H-hydrate dehydratase/NAD(P)H-hydrate epimerase [Synechococcus sp. PCC 7502]AFY74140.1 yjeF-like protein, hydroxyethylthiazole kinase-related protein [Synechococcus sp. PCC 7502]
MTFNQFNHQLSNGIIVTTAQMQAIETLMFDSGMPVAALMEKVAGLITQRFNQLYPSALFPKVGVLVGCGHNGGDALVVARELWCQGRDVRVYLPIPSLKPLTAQHWQYAQSIGIPEVALEELKTCYLLIDGLFGFGLSRSLARTLAEQITQINTWNIPILSIDLPSGLHTDTGVVMGAAIKATHTLCLGLWKRGLFIEEALPYIGSLERIDFDIPTPFINQVIHQDQQHLRRIDPKIVLSQLPLHRPIATHKYQVGHLLLIGGSQRYGGAVILAALGARATGVGMLSIAVPASLRDLVLAQVPEALIISCPETTTGAIAHLPDLDFTKYTAIACGVGISLDAHDLVTQVLGTSPNLLLDADALTLLAQIGIEKLQERSPLSTVLTPHWGEFRGLFPEQEPDRLTALNQAAIATKSVILLKGARTAIGFTHPQQQLQTWINPESTPALARGGSGDVLTGIIGGLLAQGMSPWDSAIAGAVWHAQAGRWLAAIHTEMGVHPQTLAEHLLPYLARSYAATL